MKAAAPSLFSDSRAPRAFCGLVLELPERKLISAPRPLTMPATMASPAEPGGIWRMKSAVSEPLCGAPTLVAEAIRSGRTAAT
ncbi:hypothetical protein D3C78_1780520 [compost metagenome]